jgi:hypothetical protein
MRANSLLRLALLFAHPCLSSDLVSFSAARSLARPPFLPPITVQALCSSLRSPTARAARSLAIARAVKQGMIFVHEEAGEEGAAANWALDF